MRLTRGLLVGSMLGMAAAMMMNNQNKENNSSYNADMNRRDSVLNNSNSKPHGSDVIITDIIR